MPLLTTNTQTRFDGDQTDEPVTLITQQQVFSGESVALITQPQVFSGESVTLITQLQVFSVEIHTLHPDSVSVVNINTNTI